METSGDFGLVRALHFDHADEYVEKPPEVYYRRDYDYARQQPKR